MEVNPSVGAHAMDGDKVKVQLLAKRRNADPEAEVIEILESKNRTIVGKLQVTKGFAFLITESKTLANDIFIPKDKLKGGKNGDKVVARIIEWPDEAKNPLGEVIDILGKAGENNAEMHAIGIMEEAQYQSRGGELAELRAYLLAKLLWNPFCDANAVVDDFINGYYGSAAKAMRQYFDLLQSIVKPDTHLTIYPKADDPIFTDDFIKQGSALFEKAKKDCVDEETLSRIERASLAMLYLKCMGKYRIYKNRIEMYLASERGRRVLNYTYSWGASIVILGAMFKILHLPYANQILMIAMTVESIVFFVSAFEHPFSEYHWEDVFPVLKSKNPMDRPDFTGTSLETTINSTDNMK